MKNKASYGASAGNMNSIAGAQNFGETAKFKFGTGAGVGAGAGLKGKCDFDAEEESVSFGFGGNAQALLGLEIGAEIKLKNPINKDVRDKFANGDVLEGSAAAVKNTLAPVKDVVNTITDTIAWSGNHIRCRKCKYRCCYKCEAPKGFMAFCSKFEGVFSVTCTVCKHDVGDHGWE